MNMKTTRVSLFKNQLVFAVSRRGKVFPFFGVNARERHNLYVNYIVTGDHVSLHAEHSPAIKHHRSRDSRSDLYEVEVQRHDKGHIYEILGSRGVSVDWFDERHLRPLDEGILASFKASKTSHLRIMRYEEFLEAGWRGGGLSVASVVVPRDVGAANPKEVLDRFLPPRDKEVIITHPWFDHLLVLTVFDAPVPPRSGSFGVGHRVRMRARAGAGPLLIRPFPKRKRGESVILDKGGWEEIEDRD